MKCGLIIPFGYCDPSITSKQVSPDSDTSIITTPVLLTDLNASAISLPSFLSLFVEIVAIWSIIKSLTGNDTLSKYFSTFSTPVFIPSFKFLIVLS